MDQERAIFALVIMQSTSVWEALERWVWSNAKLLNLVVQVVAQELNRC